MDRAVSKLQYFYKVYVKADRDKDTGLPIDPITQDPIQKGKQIPLLCFDSKNTNKPIKTQYFNIDTLDTWFRTRREAINPLTNLPFTDKQISTIKNYYKKNKKPFPLYISNNTADSDSDSDDESIVVNPSEILRKIYETAKDPELIAEFTHLLVTNYDRINNDSIRLDHPFFSSHYFLDTETILMRIILNDNLAALEEFLYYNPNLDFVDKRFNFKAIDLAVMSNKPLSNMILRTLLFHGARTDIPTKKGYSNELTTDIEKLSILFEFTN